MKTWRWFVGQVARLRRSIVGALALGARRRRQADHFDVADEREAGPPEHWVARVRRGAPGLLEPSLRRRSESQEAPVADRVVLSQNEPDSRPDLLEVPAHDYAPPAPMAGPPRPQAPSRPRLLRKVLRREPSVPPAEADSPWAPTGDHITRDLRAATQRVSQRAELPTAQPSDPDRMVDETRPTPAPRSLPVSDLAERSPRSQVVEFGAPAQRRTEQTDRAESPVRPVRADIARSRAANVRQAELAVEKIRPDRVWEPAEPSPEPKRESNVESLREPTVPHPASQPEPSAGPGPSPRRPVEPLSAVDPHPWPELPPSLDQVEGDVEATLRAWEHQQRIDHEQTRL